MRLAVLLALYVTLCAGCGQRDAPDKILDPAPTKSGGDIINEIFENHDPAKEELRLSVFDVAQKISATGNWSPILLTETGVGKYESTATTKDGQEFGMEVRQTKEGIYWRWKNDDASSGGSAATTW